MADRVKDKIKNDVDDDKEEIDEEETEVWSDEENEEEEEEDEDDDDGEEDNDLVSEDGIDEECVYKPLAKKRGLAKKPELDEEEVIDEEEDDDDDEDVEVLDKKIIYLEGSERKSKPILTKYEKTRLLGTRVSQLTLGAKPMIKGVSKEDPSKIAQLELEAGLIPIYIIRPLPDGKKEKWSLNELKLKKEHIIYDFKGDIKM